MTIKTLGAVALACFGLAACASTGPGSASSNGPTAAPSGITASNGGGQRAVGGIPSVGVSSSGTSVSAVPNSTGASY